MKCLHAKRSVATSLVVAGAITMAACAPSGGTAFTVNGSSMSLQQVDASSQACAKLVNTPAATARVGVSNFLLQGMLSKAIEQRLGMTVSASDVAKLAAAQNVNSLRDGGDCQQAVDGALSLVALQSRLGNEKLVAEMQKLSVKVNPQMGKFVPAQAGLSTGSGSLSGDGNISGTITGQ